MQVVPHYGSKISATRMMGLWYNVGVLGHVYHPRITWRIDSTITLKDVTGEMADISKHLNFGFYDRVCSNENDEMLLFDPSW